MNNKTFHYFISALLWVGVAFSSFFIYKKSETQEAEIIHSAQKIDELNQDFYALSNKWWERTELADLLYLDERDLELLAYVESLQEDLDRFNNSENLTFLDMSKSFTKVDSVVEKMNPLRNTKIVANKELYVKSELSRKLYNKIFLQTFRNGIQREAYKFGTQCGTYPKTELKIIEGNKIGIVINDFDRHTFGYFSFPKSVKNGFINSPSLRIPKKAI